MNAIPARISDQLDAPVIDHELRKMLLPKALDMFKYVCVPSTDATFNINNNENLIPSWTTGRSLHFQARHLQRNDIYTFLRKINHRLIFWSRWVHCHILPKFAFQNEEQKKEFLSIASEVLYFILTLGMDRPTPSMALLGLKLIPNPSNHKRNIFQSARESNRVSSRDRMSSLSQSNQVGKKRLLLLLIYSILLPKLYKAAITRYLGSNGDSDSFVAAVSDLGRDNDTNNTRLSQSQLHLQSRARIRRRKIIRRIDEIVKKIVPLMRLLNYIYFLQNTSSTTKTISQLSSPNFTNLPPPTLAMRFSGVSYACTPIYSASHDALTGSRSAPSMDESQSTTTTTSLSSSKQSQESSPPLQIHQLTNNRSINYIYAHRRLLYLELMRTLWAVIPFSPNQLTQWSRSASISSFRNWYVQVFSHKNKCFSIKTYLTY